MRSLIIKGFFLVLGLEVYSSLFASGVCFHCEEIRENNRLHHHNYEYYEDYLEEQSKSVAEIKVNKDTSNKN